jgi:hypothetical protein
MNKSTKKFSNINNNHNTRNNNCDLNSGIIMTQMNNQNNNESVTNNTNQLGKTYGVLNNFNTIFSDKNNLKFKTNFNKKKIKNFFSEPNPIENKNNKNTKLFNSKDSKTDKITMPIFKIFSFLKLKDRKKIRHVTPFVFKCFTQFEKTNLETKIKNKQENMNTKINPFSLIDVKDFKLKAQKINLVLSEFSQKDEVNSKQNNLYNIFNSFVDCLHSFYFLNGHEKTLDEKIQEIESNVINKNCYLLFDGLLNNIMPKDKRVAYNYIKDLTEKNSLSFACCNENIQNNSSMSSQNIPQINSNQTPENNIVLNVLPLEFKYFIDIFKNCKRILDDDIKMVNLLEIEILIDKIEKLKTKLNYY